MEIDTLVVEIFAERIFENFGHFGQIRNSKSQIKSNFAYSQKLIL